ncbi:MAG: pyruvate kinase [Bacteroidia bacterium]
MNFNRTKIIATMGPASQSREVLERMIDAGVNVCRINASHGNHEGQQIIIDTIRKINEEKNINTAILYDLQGPKLRIGEVVNNSVMLNAGDGFELTIKECMGDEKKVYIKYPSFIKDVNTGDTILIDDGKIELKVVSNNGVDTVKTTVTYGGELSSKKGVNLPDTKITLPSLTEKDKADLEFALANNVDWIGLSFVRSAKDIEALKSIIRYKNNPARVIAKIEKPEAVKDIDSIIAVTDGVMVARGDLGVEVPLEQVPLIQKMILNKCIRQSKPVIIATQMMESMITSQRPTRAEVNDVANAVMDGADAVMLSAETSVGRDPVNVVRNMWKIISAVQESDSIYGRSYQPDPASSTFLTDSILYSACQMADQTDAKVILTMTHSGYSALKLASQRPDADIVVFTDNRLLLTSLSLVWGVRGYFYDRYESTDVNISDVKEIIKNNNIVKRGDRVIHVFSTPLLERGRANTVKLNVID